MCCSAMARPVVAILVAKLQLAPSPCTTSMLANLVIKFGNGMAGVHPWHRDRL